MYRHIGKKRVFLRSKKKGFMASVKIFLDKIRDMIDKKESSSAGRKTAKFTKMSPQVWSTEGKKDCRPG